MNDEMERYRRDSDHKVRIQSHKSEARASNPRRAENGGLKSDSSSASRVVASRSSRTKAPDSLPAINKPVSLNSSSSVPSNPRRNPPTTIPVEQGIRPNRGRPRPQGSVDSPAQPSNTRASTPPRKPSSTRKKIV